MNKYINDNWIELPTEEIKQDNKYYYYKTKLDSLSLFAITAEKENEKNESVKQETNNITEQASIINIEQPIKVNNNLSVNDSIKNITKTKEIQPQEIILSEIIFLMALMISLFFIESKKDKKEDLGGNKKR